MVGKRQPSKDADLKGLQERLAHLARNRPGLAEHARFLGRALPHLLTNAVRPRTPELSAHVAELAWSRGQPLLREVAIHLDQTVLERRWEALWEAVPVDRALTRVVRELNIQELAVATIRGDLIPVIESMEGQGLDPGLASVILRLTLFPDLSLLSREYAVEGQHWDQGCCPICGSAPALGEFRGLEQVRRLRCGLCAADWQFARLRCPNCACTDHRRLRFFHVQGEENRYRVAACRACGNYVKMVSTLTPLSGLDLIVTEAETLHLDVAAAEFFRAEDQ